MQYVVESSRGTEAKVEGHNWLAAMANAAGLLDFEADEMTRWVVERNSSGVFNILDSRGISYTVRPDVEAPKIALVGQEEIMELLVWDEPTAPFDDDITPVLAMPVKSMLQKSHGIDLAEELFEVTSTLAEQLGDDAASTALEHAGRYVGASWGAVAKGAPEDLRMNFIAGFGARGRNLIGHETSFHAGVAGQCHESAMTVRVDDPRGDKLAHLPDRARADIASVLCIPMVSDDGCMQGVLHFADVQHPLSDTQLMAAEEIGRMLANRMNANRVNAA